MKWLPNALTLVNLFFGLLAILQSVEGRFEMAAIFLVVSLVCDFLDGTAANLLNAKSSIGKDLDSLADLVSFGVSPAFLLFFFWEGTNPSIYGLDPAYLALFIPLISAYRLAVFNTSEQSSEYFSGLPTPAFAVLSFAVPLSAEMSSFGTFNSSPLEILLILGMAFLMVSGIKLLSFKLGSKNKFLNKVRIITLLCFGLSLAFFKFFGLILCLLIYLVISLTIQKRFNTL